MKKRMMFVAGALTMTLLVAACGSDEDTSSTTEASPATESVATEPMTIVETAAGNPDFETLVAAVGAADLAETLSAEGPYTVFAPTDDAFAALPEGTVDSLLKPKNQDQLAGILTYHVVAGEIMAADVTSGEVETVNGATFEVTADGSGVTITDGQGNTANVIATDIDASNGVIHVIDAVLLPPS